MYGIGGAPEGVISAAVIRALDGDMQARLLPRHEVKGDSAENRRIGEQELARCREMGIEAGQVLRMDQMARNDNVIFSATGITKGDLLEGISRQGNMATTETLLIRGKSRTAASVRPTIWIAKTRRCTSFCCKPTRDRPQQPLRAGSSRHRRFGGQQFPTQQQPQRLHHQADEQQVSQREQPPGQHLHICPALALQQPQRRVRHRR